MEPKQEDKKIISDRLQTILNNLSKCKIDFYNEREECKKIREINSKLEVELKEARELEKSHRYHLQTSRDMIRNLQETVSQLVYLKRDIKKVKDELLLRDSNIASLEKDKETIFKQHKEEILELRAATEKDVNNITVASERKSLYLTEQIVVSYKVQQTQHESDTQIAQFTCVIEELRSKIKDMETENRDKMNIVVLEYEEKIQRSSAQMAQLQEQLARQAARHDANIDAYRRRLEELEEKLKQSQFKQYLAQSSYTPQYESQVERPYSVDRDKFSDSIPYDLNPVQENSKQKASQKTPRASNTLQVMYSDHKSSHIQKPTEKKGQFNITKKRKLYSDKDLHDF